MNKKGFTLVELLAVIAILAVLSMITVPMVMDTIEEANKKAFLIGAQNVIDSAKQYVVETENFSLNKIVIEDLEDNLDNYNYISGVVLISEDDSYSVDGLSDGKYCASGTKNNMQVIKGDCSKLDNTPPVVKVFLNKRTSNSITILVDAIDETSGIYGYSYSTDGINYSEITKQNIYTISGLNKNETVKVYVRVYNNIYDETNSEENLKLSMTEEVVEYTTSDIEKPRFVVSTSSGSASSVKIVDIIFPPNDGGYEYSYEIDDEKYIITEEKVTLTITSNCTLKAKITTTDEVIESELRIAGLDNEGPEVDIIYNKTWESSKKIKVVVIYEQTGLPEEPYSYDGGITWTSSDEKVYVTGEVVTDKIKVRDVLGNITTKFTVNGEEAEELIIDYVDNEKPNCSLKVTSGTLGSNDWYTSNVVVDFDELTDVAKYCNNGVCENKQPGSGIKSSSIDKPQIQNDGTTKVTGTVVDNAGNSTTCTIDIKKDSTVASIKANSSSVNLTFKENKNITSLFTIGSYGVSSGNTTCYLLEREQRTKTITNNNELALGINVVVCDTTTGSGSSKSATVVIRHNYVGTPYCSSGVYQNGTCYFESNQSVCGTTQVPTTKQEYSTCATTKNTCQYGCDSVWNSCLTGSANQCVGGNVTTTGYDQCSACGPDYTRCKSWGSWSNVTCYGSSTNCSNNKGSNTASTQYQCVSYTECGTNAMLQKRSCVGRYYAYCNNCPVTVWSDCATTTNTCQGGYESKNCSSCKTGSPNECQAGYITVNTTETVAASCNKSEYIKYSCLTGGTNTASGGAITATATNNICQF